MAFLHNDRVTIKTGRYTGLQGTVHHFNIHQGYYYVYVDYVDEPQKYTEEELERVE